MSGLDKMKAQILKEAETSAQEILSKAREEAQKIMKNAQEEAEAQARRSLQRRRKMRWIMFPGRLRLRICRGNRRILQRSRR